MTALDAAGYDATLGGTTDECPSDADFANALCAPGGYGAGLAASLGRAPGSAVVLGTQSAIKANGVPYDGTYLWPVDDTGGGLQVPGGSAVQVYTQPSLVVPECDAYWDYGEPEWTLDDQGPGSAAGFPESFSQCASELAAAGFTDVIQEPSTGSLWDDFYGCSGDPCPAPDASGTVELTTGQDPTTYVPGSLDTDELAGTEQSDASIPIFVYVDDFEGALVGAPGDSTGTTTTETGTGTATGTTTSTATVTTTTTTPTPYTTTSPFYPVPPAVTTTTPAVTTTSPAETNTDGTTTPAETTTYPATTTTTPGEPTTQPPPAGQPVPGPNPAPAPAPEPTPDPGSSNCVVSDTCTPPDPFSGPTIDPKGIFFPNVRHPVTCSRSVCRAGWCHRSRR